MTQYHPLSYIIPESLAGLRLDVALSQLIPEYSRSVIQRWIKAEMVLVDAKPAMPKQTVQAGQVVEVRPEQETVISWEAQDVDIDVVYEDNDLLVINKPSDLVVHPAAGHHDNTLVNGLLHHYPELDQVPRGGIVHRLDKDTTGLMVVARSLIAHNSLVQQLQNRSVSRIYYAIANGHCISGGTVHTQMGRHPRARQKMAVLPHGGKEAITHYRVLEKFPKHTLLRLQLETGRTHQIRVHMASIGHGLVGDKTYSAGKLMLPKNASQTLRTALQQFSRQALHAKQLSFIHPQTGDFMQFEVDLPEDINYLLELLKNDHC